MTVEKRSTSFWKILFNPRVSSFIIVGIAIMFLTFSTNSNALEIAISGIASIFIGIAVNNITTLETNLKREEKFTSKTKHLSALMQLIKKEINSLKQLNKETEIIHDLSELGKLIDLAIMLIGEK